VLDVGGVVLGGAWGIRLSGALAYHVRYHILFTRVCWLRRRGPGTLSAQDRVDARPRDGHRPSFPAKSARSRLSKAQSSNVSRCQGSSISILAPSSFPIGPLRPLSKGLDKSVIMVSIAAWRSAPARGSFGAWTRRHAQGQVQRARGGVLNRRLASRSASAKRNLLVFFGGYGESGT